MCSIFPSSRVRDLSSIVPEHQKEERKSVSRFAVPSPHRRSCRLLGTWGWDWANKLNHCCSRQGQHYALARCKFNGAHHMHASPKRWYSLVERSNYSVLPLRSTCQSAGCAVWSALCIFALQRPHALGGSPGECRCTRRSESASSDRRSHSSASTGPGRRDLVVHRLRVLLAQAYAAVV